jgi:hypothetical protein
MMHAAIRYAAIGYMQDLNWLGISMQIRDLNSSLGATPCMVIWMEPVNSLFIIISATTTFQCPKYNWSILM